MILDVKYDSNLADMKRLIQNGGIKSISRAINDSLAKGRTQLGKSVRALYAIKAADFNKNAVVTKSSPGDLKKGKNLVK